MTPTLFSVSYAGLWGQHRLDLEAFIAKAAALGYFAVELMGKRPHLSVLDANDATLERLRQCAHSNRVEIATIAGYTDFTTGKTAREVPFIEMQVAYVRDLARIAQKLGARIVRVFTGYTTDPESHADDWDRCVKAIRECSAAAEQFGVILGVQNHHDTAIGCDAYIEFLNDVDHPNCHAMFDPWAPALNGEDLYKYAKLLAPRMVQTTLADYVRLPRFQYLPGLVNYKTLPAMMRAVPVGEGFLDLEAFFKGLKEGGFDGYVAYEMCSPLRGGSSEENLDRTARTSLERIKKLITQDEP
ncbi:MAG: sugar phosphate isomerase/epimerase [Candidatus Hydrogenedentes bacterium]|nr:sugar phosphate isomerase/epimerase [Candidatus Hydrogenedentota bacterium]